MAKITDEGVLKVFKAMSAARIECRHAIRKHSELAGVTSDKDRYLFGARVVNHLFVDFFNVVFHQAALRELEPLPDELVK